MAKPAKRGMMAQVLSRMAATETLISDRHAESMLIGLLAEAERVEDPAAQWETVRSELCASWDVDDGGPQEARKPFIYRDGVAVIPVHGVLMNRFNHCWGFATGYDFIRRQKNLALADPDVDLIVYDHDTPGGEAAGCDELAREIYDARTIKPSMALVNTLSASGGFWLASASNRIVAAPSASVGSIGVYIQHMMIAKMLAEYGIEVEFIKRGEYKTSGNAFESLSKKDREYLQSMVDQRYDEFVGAVAEFRGIEEKVARDTEARVMRPAEALSLGLIDAVEAPAKAVATFIAEMGRERPQQESEEDIMATENTTEITSAQKAEIANEAKARIKGICAHESAKGREKLAEHLAYDTDSTVEQAVAILNASPKAESTPPPEAGDKDGLKEDKDGDKTDKDSTGDQGTERGPGKGDDKDGDQTRGRSQFESAMDQDKHPNVGADKDGNGDERSEQEKRVAEILGAQTLATGRRHDNRQAAH